jgi:hypothetical protein
VLGQELACRQPLEEDNSLVSDLTTILWSRRRNVGNEVKDRGFVEVVVVAMDVEAVVELLQTLADFFLMPSLEL